MQGVAALRVVDVPSETVQTTVREVHAIVLPERADVRVAITAPLAIFVAVCFKRY
jgi:hypothetical protein